MNVQRIFVQMFVRNPTSVWPALKRTSSQKLLFLAFSFEQSGVKNTLTVRFLLFSIDQMGRLCLTSFPSE